MSRPLSSLTPAAQAVLQAIGSSPDDPLLRLVAPDEIEHEGYGNLADVLRRDQHAALHMVLRGGVPEESHCAQLLQQTGDVSQKVSQALWTTERPPIPDLRTENGARQQYEAQRIILASGGLPVPDCFETVQEHLATTAVCEDLEKGPRLLLLVPRRPLAEYIVAMKEWLRENVHALKLRNGASLAENPVFCSNRYDKGLEYHCRVVGHDGRQTFVWKSEKEWLAEKNTDILVLEPAADLPDADRDRSAEQAWRNRRPGEIFQTPQSWSVFFRTLLERGELLDAHTLAILAGARFAACESASRLVPSAYWSPGDRRGCFNCNNPGFADGRAGARVAVRDRHLGF